MSYIVQIANNHADQFCEEFLDWLPQNLHVYYAFEEEAIRIHKRGFKHYSARTIVHVLRHHSAVSESGSQWKINDHHSPYLARLFDIFNPWYEGLFEYRTIKKPKRRCDD